MERISKLPPVVNLKNLFDAETLRRREEILKFALRLCVSASKN